MGDTVEIAVESAESEQIHRGAPIEVRMLGRLTIIRDGQELALPASRKVRGLLAYLLLAPSAVMRGQLCELLWDVPDDPRGELRWCLSKIRSLVDEPGRRRVETKADAVSLDVADCAVDAIEVMRVAQPGIKAIAPDMLRSSADLFRGDFLEGMEIERSPTFSGWLAAQRRRFRGLHAAILERLVDFTPDDEVQRLLDKWLELSPFDEVVHQHLFNALARRGQIREAEEHLAATTRLFDAEGLDYTSLSDAWRLAKSQQAQIVGKPEHAERSAVSITSESDQETPTTPRQRSSVAVMPFTVQSSVADMPGGIGDALAHDVIARLAKLRSVFVIAQGSVFALRDRQIGPEQAGRMLNVQYIVSGTVRRLSQRIVVTAELAEVQTARIVWTEDFDHPLDDAFLVLESIGDRIVASVAGEIETVERNRAILKPPNSLDAWEAHHRGLWHMYRFNKTDNDQAQHFFEIAVRLDPTFSRAYAGLSFTHFQNAFQGWTDRGPEVERAIASAGQSLMVDERDPAAHLAMGRALWLRGRHEECFAELERTVELSPNFASGHYTLGFVHSQVGDPSLAISSSDHSRYLSPCDPLLFGMLGSRAMALLRLGRYEEAADWGIRAASRPNAHAHIRAIAAYALSLAGQVENARSQIAIIHKDMPGYNIAHFLHAMQFSPDDEHLLRECAKRLEDG